MSSQNKESAPAALFFNYGNAVFNLINSVIGAGIITLPFNLKKGGSIFGMVSMIVCSILIVYTADIMVVTTKKICSAGKEEPVTYGHLCRKTVGTWLYYTLVVMTFIMMFLAMCVYMIILKSEAKSIIGDIMNKTFIYEKYVLIGIAVALILPLCLLKDISMLGYTSFISIISVLTILIIVLVRSGRYHKLMADLTPEKALKYQKHLEFDRTIWLCGLKDNGLDQNIYANINDQDSTLFRIHRVENTEVLIEKIQSIKGNCLSANVLEAVREIDEELKLVETPTPDFILTTNKPDSWEDAVNQAHSLSLFLKNSINAEGRSFQKGPTLWARLSTLGTYASAFICQQCVFSIYRTLKKRTVKAWRLVSLMSYVAILIICLTLAYVGYSNQEYQVGEAVFDKLKLRYYTDSKEIDWAVNTGRILLSITIILTFPMQNFFMRRNLLILSYEIDSRVRNIEYDCQKPPNIIFYTLTLIVFACVLIIGLFLDSIITVYSLMGAILAAPIIYIFPVLCYLAVGEGMKEHFSSTFGTRSVPQILRRVVLPVFNFIFGVLILVISTVSEILNLLAK